MTRSEKARPGFLIFHDTVPTFRKMSLEAVGRFVLAMADYSLYRIHPDFGDDVRSDTLWDNVQPRLEANFSQYEADILQKKFAGWCSSLKDAHLEYLRIPFEDWKLAQVEYDKYLQKSLSEQKTPLLFNQWLEWQKDHSTEAGSLPSCTEAGSLPF